MAKKLKEMEAQWRKEKEQANEAFQQERKVEAAKPYFVFSQISNNIINLCAHNNNAFLLIILFRNTKIK